MSMGCEKHDLLSRFMVSQGESYTGRALRDVVISFLLAGRETTSSSLSWFFWLLSSRPDVERRIRDDVAAVRARRAICDLGRAGFDLDELREMHYVHAAITESMRLYPPVPVNSLQAKAADVLPDGTAVGAGWFVAYNSYAMGRMESVWGKDALAYRPERWLDPAEGTFRPESPFRYMAFHAGPRICLGKEMAYIQMKSIVACVLEEFELAVDGAYRPRQVASLTLRMADGLPAGNLPHMACQMKKCIFKESGTPNILKLVGNRTLNISISLEYIDLTVKDPDEEWGQVIKSPIFESTKTMIARRCHSYNSTGDRTQRNSRSQ
uniref:Cytochrome P450 86A2 n=1 Tax=Aegilops tauschii TaxID=37682 RepID=R7W2U0_AEGTA